VIDGYLQIRRAYSFFKSVSVSSQSREFEGFKLKVSRHAIPMGVSASNAPFFGAVIATLK
jgi:hypothetical protein